MKKSRKFSRSLGNHFDRSVEPIYLVSSDRQIIYMNSACLTWVGLEAEDAENLTCFFTSDATEAPKDDPVKGLCPPPTLFSTEQPQPSIAGMTANVFVSSPEGVDSRRATFHPLTENEQLLGVLVIVGQKATGQSGEPTASGATNDHHETSQAQALHDALAAVGEHHRKNFSLGNLVGSSPFAERLRRQTAAIIGLDAETLIVGPAGSGREHLARTIAASCYEDDNFPVVLLHCVLADDELTQESIDQVTSRITQRTRRGRAIPTLGSEQVNPILLLLDIDKLNHSALRLVEDFLKNNGNACRVIATSEVSLLQLAQEDKFPRHVAHQLTTIEIPLVPLSQRREDIPLMAQSFVEHANRTRKTQLSGFDDSSMQLLNEFHWPGNLEQLQQVVGQACENAAGPIISIAALPDSFRHAVEAVRIGEPEQTTIDLNQWLEQLELELIQRAVLQTKGNKTKAAQLLSISRSRLIRRMEHFQLSAPTNKNEKSDKANKNEKSDAAQVQSPTDPPTPSDQQIDSSAFEELE